MDMNTLRYDDCVASWNDAFPSLLWRECAAIEPAISRLACTRCGCQLAAESLRRVKPAPSSQWRELCEELYCEHGGSVHSHEGFVVDGNKGES